MAAPALRQVLRTLRLLRPLASISTSPSMRILIKSLAASLQLLGSVLALCSFMYLLYGIVGVELWMGTFRRHCVHELTGDILDVNQVCGLCPEGYVCQVTPPSPPPPPPATTTFTMCSPFFDVGASCCARGCPPLVLLLT